MSASPTPTPQYKPADATGPAQNVPLPVKPPLADEFSKAGIEAFAKYWYETLSYAFETGDLKPLQAVSDPSCVPCDKASSSIVPWHQEGRWTAGGKMILNGAESSFEKAPDSTYQVISSVTQSAMSYYQADGSLFETHPESKPITDILVGVHRDGRWSAITVEHLGGK